MLSGQSRSNAPSPSRSKKENYPGNNFVFNDPKHHFITPSGRRSLSPLKSHNTVSSNPSSSSPKSKRDPFSKRVERYIKYKNSTKSKGFTPYSRNNGQSDAQSLVAENQPRNSSVKFPNLNSCGNNQCPVIENLPGNSSLRTSFSQHGNVKESVGGKTFSPIVLLGNSNTTIHFEINKSLTESMTLEFDKTFRRETVSFPKYGKKHKITQNPVKSKDVYKRYSNDNIYASHTTTAAKLRSPTPPLHPGNPRKCPSCDTERDSTPKSPLSLPVPGIHWAKPATQPKQIEEKQGSDLPSHNNLVQITPELAQKNLYFRPISSKYLTQNDTENRLENAN